MGEAANRWIEMNEQHFDVRYQQADARVSGRRYRTRAQRFVPPKPVLVLARPKGARFYSFWLEATNLSATGFLLIPDPRVVLPFSEGASLEVTVDLTGTMFDRPLHMLIEVARINKGANGRLESFAGKILDADPLHVDIFWNGMKAVGAANRAE